MIKMTQFVLYDSDTGGGRHVNPNSRKKRSFFPLPVQPAVAGLVLLSCFILTPHVYGYGHLGRSTRTEAAGDVLQFAVPAAGLAAAVVCEDDWQGAYQLAGTLIASQLVTEGLKLAVDKERPNGRSSNSFPSGHSTAAFAGASFIHRRYGWQYSLPAYGAAGFVAYSRVHAEKHYVEDVLAGAAIGIISSFLIVRPYERVQVAAVGDGHSYRGIALSLRW